jgi:2-hydroxychromene-2-carboxylate isomerase
MGAITPIHVTRCGDVVLGREIEAIEQLDEAAQEARYQAEQDLTFDEVLEEIAESFTSIDKAMFMDRLMKDTDEARKVLHRLCQKAFESVVEKVITRQER